MCGHIAWFPTSLFLLTFLLPISSRFISTPVVHLHDSNPPLEPTNPLRLLCWKCCLTSCSAFKMESVCPGVAGSLSSLRHSRSRYSSLAAGHYISSSNPILSVKFESVPQYQSCSMGCCKTRFSAGCCSCSTQLWFVNLFLPDIFCVTNCLIIIIIHL